MPRRPTKWTVLRYNYPDDPLDPQLMWAPTGLPDDIHMIWAPELLVMEIWYGKSRRQTHSLEQLLTYLNVATLFTHEDSTHHPALLDGR